MAATVQLPEQLVAALTGAQAPQMSKQELGDVMAGALAKALRTVQPMPVIEPSALNENLETAGRGKAYGSMTLVDGDLKINLNDPGYIAAKAKYEAAIDNGKFDVIEYRYLAGDGTPRSDQFYPFGSKFSADKKETDGSSIKVAKIHNSKLIHVPILQAGTTGTRIIQTEDGSYLKAAVIYCLECSPDVDDKEGRKEYTVDSRSAGAAPFRASRIWDAEGIVITNGPEFENFVTEKADKFGVKKPLDKQPNNEFYAAPPEAHDFNGLLFDIAKALDLASQGCVKGESTGTEVAKDQIEMGMHFTEVNVQGTQSDLRMAVMAEVAKRHGKGLDFSPKPEKGVNGSGLHDNEGAAKDGSSILMNKEAGKWVQTDAGKSMLAGLMKYANAGSLVTNQHITSGLRLGGGEAPVALFYSEEDTRNRTALVTLKDYVMEARYVDGGLNEVIFHPNPTPDNPQGVVALNQAVGFSHGEKMAMVSAMKYKGLKDGLVLDEAKYKAVGSIYEKDDIPKDQLLPTTLQESLDLFKAEHAKGDECVFNGFMTRERQAVGIQRAEELIASHKAYAETHPEYAKKHPQFAPVAI